MSKRNSDGDVIANRLSLVEAKGQKFLASLLGPQTEPSPSSNDAKAQDEDEDLKVVFGHDRLGVGGILPQDIADGSFTRRIPTSNDKLLEQLVGKKRAKAHIAAKQEAARPNAKAQRLGKPATQRKEESEDEEEGRAATFKSKRRKGTEGRSVVTKQEEGSDDENEDEESRTKRLEGGTSSEGRKEEVDHVVEIKDEQTEVVEEPEVAGVNRRAQSRSKAKPKSFLDEILAERSKKKNRKNKDGT